MFGTLGGPELFLIFVVALIVFGPRKLPDIGKSLGRMMSEFRRASNDFKSTIESEVESEKIKESMRIEPPKVEPVKARPPAEAAAAGAAVAASDGADPSSEADESPDSEMTARASEPEDRAETDATGTTDSPESGTVSDDEPAPPPESVPTTVSRQPPAPVEESK